MTTWTPADAAHLLRRAGFGGTYAQVLQLHALGREAAIDSLVEYAGDNPPEKTTYPASLGLDTSKALGAMQAQLYEMLTSPWPLREKLAWFWHGHFVSALGKSPAPLMLQQMDTWRAYADGHFLDFLYAMYKDPAMLVYLDNNSNVVGQPNENFAREVMELFTLGIGNYTETDIKEAARALTGWTINQATRNTAQFVARRHDNGVKTLLGVTGNLDGDDVMDILYAQPATATRLCTRLYQYFVAPSVPSDDLTRLQEAWRSSDGLIREVLHVLFRLESFWAPETREALMKTPMEFGIGLYQRLAMPITSDSLRALIGALNGMGQTPLMPPDVSGYPEGLEWAGTSNLLNRYNSVQQLVNTREANNLLSAFVADVDKSSARALLDGLLTKLGPVALGAPSDAAILAYLNSGGYPSRNASQLAAKIKGALHLIASTPEYQLN